MSDENTEPGERPRGILSPADRNFLRGTTEYAHASTATERRNAIRERVHSSLRDYRVLLEHLPDALREQAFREEKVDEKINVGVRNSVIDGLAFLYLGLSDATDGNEVSEFTDAIEDALGRAYEQRGRAIESVDVSIEVEEGGALEELDTPLEELPEATLVQLMQSDRITLSEYTEAVKNQE